jgi:PI-3-kinase-related kinase SMG-1
VESPVLLEPLVKCLVQIGKNYRQYFSQHFKNTVDILVGWHIDTAQEPALLEFVSGMHRMSVSSQMFVTPPLSSCSPGALQSFTFYWAGDMQFTLDLMNQFLEDMEAYSIVSSPHTPPLTTA